jgi:hypothetical protein
LAVSLTRVTFGMAERGSKPLGSAPEHA